MVPAKPQTGRTAQVLTFSMANVVVDLRDQLNVDEWCAVR